MYFYPYVLMFSWSSLNVLLGIFPLPFLWSAVLCPESMDTAVCIRTLVPLCPGRSLVLILDSELTPMPQELNSDSSFVTDSHCNNVKGTWPQCTSVKDLPGVICFFEMYLTNVCEDN